MKIEMSIEYLPPKEICGNSRLIPLAKANISKTVRQSGYMHAIQAMHRNKGPFPLRGNVQVEYIFELHGNNRRRDLDNLAIGMKPFLDGIVDAGVMKDDRQVVKLHAERILSQCNGVTIRIRTLEE